MTPEEREAFERKMPYKGWMTGDGKTPLWGWLTMLGIVLFVFYLIW